MSNCKELLQPPALVVDKTGNNIGNALSNITTARTATYPPGTLAPWHPARFIPSSVFGVSTF